MISPRRGKKNLAVAESMAAALPGFFPWDNAVNEFSVKLHFLPGKCIGFLPTCVFKVVRSTSLAGEQPISSKACGATSARATTQQARPGTFTLFTTSLCPHLNTGAHNDWNHLKARLQQHHTLSDSTGRPHRFQQKVPSTLRAQSKSPIRPPRSSTGYSCILRLYPITQRLTQGAQGRQMTRS